MSTPKSAAAWGSTPIMTNSVVPMPKAPMASASSATGTALLPGWVNDYSAVPELSTGSVQLTDTKEDSPVAPAPSAVLPTVQQGRGVVVIPIAGDDPHRNAVISAERRERRQGGTGTGRRGRCGATS